MKRYNHRAIRLHYPSTFLAPLFIGLMIVAGSSALLGCAPQPESMFEQQAEAQAANEIGAHSTIQSLEASAPSASTVTDTTNRKSVSSINISKQQAIARQPNCDTQQTTCQYLELNTLAFTPPQPWLESIMWQTVARVLSPDTPLTSQRQVAKDSILALLKQIEFNSQGVSSQPKYQRIDTDLILNKQPVAATVDMDTAANNGEVMTGYLQIESTQHRDDAHQQWHLDYVMLDMQKKLQLTVEDILLPEVDTQSLLDAFNGVKKQWLAQQGIEQQYLEQWPLPLSEHWYLDQQGLHLVYQSGALLNSELNAVDLVVPFSELEGIIKPSYKVSSSTSMTSSKR